MVDSIEIRVYEVVGDKLCVASEDGQKVYERITAAFNEGRKVQLSFQNVESLTSAFLNAAVGQLYGEYDENEIKNLLLPPKYLESEDLALLKRVVDTAKEYFKDTGRFDKIREEVLGDGE